jgi:hypothetical protein
VLLSSSFLQTIKDKIILGLGATIRCWRKNGHLTGQMPVNGMARWEGAILLHFLDFEKVIPLQGSPTKCSPVR